MEVSFDKAAILEYMEAVGNIGLSCRRTMDESLANHKICVQTYSRIHSEIEQTSRKAYNRLESAESLRRSADAEHETARRILENSEEESARNSAQERMQRAQKLQAEADAEIAQASSELAACRAKMNTLNTLWEQYTSQVEPLKRNVEDGYTAFVTVSEKGNGDLGTFMAFMEKAKAELYGTSGVASSAERRSASRERTPGTGTADSVPRKPSPLSENTTAKGNSFGVICSGGQEQLVMRVNGTAHSFPYTKSGLAKACRMAASSGDQEMIAHTESIFQNRKKAVSSARDDKWNKEYMPLVQDNIRRSVDLYFSDYVCQEKLENCLQAISFMDQAELARRANSDLPEGTLGFNNGSASNIAHDVKSRTCDGRVGDKAIEGSKGANINYAFVTAVHENLHMMSANDTPYERRRGLMVGGDETSRAMNEAFTEYFTFLSCGGEKKHGGLNPGSYSGYQVLMQEMPTIEKAVGRDCMMDAYFNNKPQRMRAAIDAILGDGAWDDMCSASYDLLYQNNAGNGAARLVGYLKQLSDDHTN